MIISAGVAAILVALLILWWRQERITFQPPPPPFDDAGDTPRVVFAAPDGVPLSGYLVGHCEQGLVIAFHGNADLAVWQIPWARELAKRSGWQVLLVEYRGYAGNRGLPSYLAVRADARAALAFVTNTLGVPTSRIAYFGHSLGSAVAAELAAESPPAALILQSPFTSARDMARIIVARPIAWIWNLVSRVHYDTAIHVATLEYPVHVAHGERDRLVPTRMGRRVHDQARVKGQLLIVPGAGHNDVATRAGDTYWQWLVSALASASGAHSPPGDHAGQSVY